MSTPQPDSAATGDSGGRSLFWRPAFWVVAAVLVVVIEVTVVQFLDRAPPPTTVIGPPAGQHLAAVQLQYVNGSRRAYEDSLANQITLIDSQGRSFSPGGKGTAAGAEFERGQLSLDPGEVELGFVSFFVSDGSTVVKVQVRLDSGYGDAGQWQVS